MHHHSFGRSFDCRFLLTSSKLEFLNLNFELRNICEQKLLGNFKVGKLLKTTGRLTG